jgi:hypothetical protein
LRSFAIAFDSSVMAGTSAIVFGRLCLAGENDHSRSSSGMSNSAMALAFVIAARIFAPLRTIEASCISRSTSPSPNSATFSGSKSRNTRRNAGRLRRIVIHDSPDWNDSRHSRSYSASRPWSGTPHSVSWYAT